MKKKILVYITAITLILAGCGSSAAKSTAGVETSTATEQAAEAVEAGSNEDSDKSFGTEKIDASKDSTNQKSSELSKENTKQKSSESSKEDTKQKSPESSKENTKQKSSESSKDNTNQKSSETSKKSSEESDAQKQQTNQKQTKEQQTNQEQTEEQPAQQQTPAPEQPAPAEQPKTPETPKAPEKTDYGRILFVGDSRTVDMFSADRDKILGEVYDGITVYAEDARSYTFFIETMSAAGTENFDTIISWMGCNDYGDFSNYQPHYEGLLREGKRLILCTVGPTLDSALANDFDKTHYLNDFQIAYNSALWTWANANGVKVIDLYSYLANATDVYLDPADGIHYQPKPTGAIWSVIRSALN